MKRLEKKKDNRVNPAEIFETKLKESNHNLLMEVGGKLGTACAHIHKAIDIFEHYKIEHEDIGKMKDFLFKKKNV